MREVFSMSAVKLPGVRVIEVMIRCSLWGLFAIDGESR